MKLKTFFLILITLFGVASFSPVRAFEIREGNEAKEVVVPQDTVIKGSLLAAGNSVIVDGTIQGDLYCVGQTIIVRGTVAGDVLCAGQTLDVSGTVGGNIRSLGQLITISAPVKRNVVVMGQTVSVAPSAVISGEFLAAGQMIRIDSSVGGDVNTAGESIILGEKARLAGNFTYASPNAATEATGAAITGKVSHVISEKSEAKPLTAKKLLPKMQQWPARAARPIIFYLILGALVVLIAKEKVLRITQEMLARPWIDGLVGFLTFIFASIAIMMLVVTIIGIPVAIILGAVFLVMVLVSRVYVAVIVGNKLLAAIGKTKSGLLLQMMIGVVIIELLAVAPVIGFFVTTIAISWGLGGIVMNLGKRKTGK